MAKKKRQQIMPFNEAMKLANEMDGDMPDGAFFAMAHDIAGLEYGDGFDEMAKEQRGPKPQKNHVCIKCNRRFATELALKDHAKSKGH